MILFKNLLMTDYGLLSLIVILFTILMGWWMSRWVSRKMDEDAPRGS